MANTLEKILDTEEISLLLEGFTKATGLGSALLDLQGNTITKLGWKDICTNFHRKNPETEKNCRKSDTILAKKLSAVGTFKIYKCLNGLIDVVMPIIVNGEHIGNLFTGQFLLESPDEQFFQQQAQRYGFDRVEYLQALSEVPVFTEEEIRGKLEFLLQMTEVIAEMGVTRIKLTEMNVSLIESENYYRNLFNHLYEGFSLNEIILDDAGKPFDYKILENNSKFAQYVGLPTEEIRGRTAREIFPSIENDAVNWIEKYGEVALTGKGFSFETYNEEVDKLFEINVFSPLYGQFATTYRDITKHKVVEQNILESQEKLSKALDMSNRSRLTLLSVLEDQRKAENEIKKLNEELEQRVTERTAQLEASNKEMEAFSYSVSHDLRAPLRHINGFAEILTKKHADQLSEDARNYLDTITGSAKKMGILIDDLLSFSRAGRTELRRVSVNMNKIIEGALTEVNASRMNRNVEWDIASLPAVDGDYNLLRQVWVNLLDNALKYTSTREKASISIGYKNGKDEVIFYIQDNGVGFDMKYVSKLFGVFQRLHSSAEFDGTGIGLANIRRIISRHGGRTWAEGELDKGATFYFSIPGIKTI